MKHDAIDFNENFQFDQDSAKAKDELLEICADIRIDHTDSNNKPLLLARKYCNKIYDYTMQIERGAQDVSFLESELEEWLFGLNADEVLNDSRQEIETHPMILLNDWYNRRLQTDSKTVSGNTVKRALRSEIIRLKSDKRRRLRLRYWDTDYKIKETGTKLRLVPLHDYGSFTPIQDIRLIEKIESVYKKKGNNCKKIKIAYFGDLVRTGDFFSQYFNKYEVILNAFRPIGELVFSDENKNVINLNNVHSQTELLLQYDLVLFLDESWFYKKHQSRKTDRENTHAQYVEWYWREIERLEDDLPAQISCYFNLFDEAREYLENRYSNNSATYELNQRLLERIKSTANSVDGCADVYFYVGNNRVADHYIDALNMCKEEYYNGESLFVYKVVSAEATMQRNQEVYSEGKASQVSVDLWKLVKSISNEYYLKYWSTNFSINELKKIKIIFEGNQADSSAGRSTESASIYSLKIRYKIIYGVPMECPKYKQVDEAVKSFMEILSSRDEFPCIRAYLRKLLAQAFLSKAIGIEGLLLAYRVQLARSLEFVEVQDGMDVLPVQRGENITFKDRKTVYNIIEKMNRLVVRDMEKLPQIMRFEVKTVCAPEMPDSVFENCLAKINSACVKLGDTESRIYQYSKERVGIR